jgi:hypothetical protein
LGAEQRPDSGCATDVDADGDRYVYGRAHQYASRANRDTDDSAYWDSDDRTDSGTVGNANIKADVDANFGTHVDPSDVAHYDSGNQRLAGRVLCGGPDRDPGAGAQRQGVERWAVDQL